MAAQILALHRKPPTNRYARRQDCSAQPDHCGHAQKLPVITSKPLGKRCFSLLQFKRLKKRANGVQFILLDNTILTFYQFSVNKKAHPTNGRAFYNIFKGNYGVILTLSISHVDPLELLEVYLNAM